MPSPYSYQSGVGGGSSAAGGTGKNYLATVNNVNGNGDFELGTTVGWSLGVTGALVNGLPTTTPTFGSGASGNLSIAASNSTPLAGSWSLNYVSSAATTAGNCLASSAFTIDSEDQAKVMTVKFYYSPTVNPSNGNWSGTSSNSFAWAIYDVTNSAWIIPAGAFGMTQSSGVGYCTGTFQTSSNGTSYRLVIYNSAATAGAITVKFDDISLGPQTAPFGPAMTDWVAYTPTITGFGTAATVTFQSRRVGDSLEVIGRFTTGTPTGVEAQITLGFNGINASVTSADTTKIPSLRIAGIGAMGEVSANLFNLVTLMEPSVGYMTLGFQGTGVSATAKALGNGFTTASKLVYVHAIIPIAGWSSNVQMSNDTDTRVVSFRGTQSSQALTANVTNLSLTTVKDTHGAWATNIYTVAVAGDYQVEITAVTSGAGTMSLYKNGSTFHDMVTLRNITGDCYTGATLLVNLVPGDTLAFRMNASVTITAGSASIYRLSGPSVIAATESVNARYYASATAVTGALATVVWTTKDFDSHNSMSSGTYTVATSGKYQVNCALGLSGTIVLNNTVDLQIQKNGTVVSEDLRYAGGALTNFDVGIEDIISCVAGDTIRAQVSSSATGPAIVASNSRNFFSITRVGN